MPFLSALSATQKNKLRGTASISPHWRGAVYLSAVPNINVYTARINQTTFNTPLAELTYDGGSGILADVVVGMTVLISHTNDRTAAFFRGRVRKTPTATILYINETDGVQFDNDDYIFVLDDFALHEKLARDDAGTLKPDWDVTFRKLKPIISDLQAGYADFVTGTTYQIAFAPTVTAATSGATISSYLWDVQDGTITVGTATSKDITATFPVGFRWVYFTATDNNGVAETRRLPIWAHDKGSNTPTLMEVGDLSISASLESGYNATIAAYSNISTMLDHTLFCFWIEEAYNGTAEHIIDNLIFVGRLRRETNDSIWDESGQLDARTHFTIEGPLTQLARLRASNLEFKDDATPTAFNEITNLTPWRAAHLVLSEYSTFSSLHSLEFDSTANTFRSLIFTGNGEDLASLIRDIIESINAIIQHDRAGRFEIVRRADFLTSAARTALVTVLDITTEDIVEQLRHDRDHFKPIGVIGCDGGFYNSISGLVTTYTANAPAGAPASGSGSSSIHAQILQADQSIAAARTELAQRAGNALSTAQEIETIQLQMLDGYWFIEPDAAAWYTLTLAGTETARGITLTTAIRWKLTQKDLTPEIMGGQVSVLATFQRETSGEAGEIIDFPAIDTGLYPVVIGEFDDHLIPDSWDEATYGCDLTTTDCRFIDTVGTYNPGAGWQPDCIGGTSEYLDMIKDLGGVKTLTSITLTYDANYAGGADGDSFIATRLAGGETTWLAFTTQTGSGQTATVSLPNVPADQIRIVMYAGGADCTGTLTITNIAFTALSDGTWSHTFDFTRHDGDWTTPSQVGFGPAGTYSAGNGWQSTEINNGAGGTGYRELFIARTFASRTITGITMIGNRVLSTSDGADVSMNIYKFNGGLTLLATSGHPGPAGTGVGLSWAGSQALTEIRIGENDAQCSPWPCDLDAGSFTLTSVTIMGSGTDPFL